MPNDSPPRISIADLSKLQDAAAVVRLLREFAREPVSGGCDLPEEVQQRLIPGLRSHHAGRIWLAWSMQEGREIAVGVAICQLGFSTFLARPTLNLHDLFVSAPHRNGRIGEALMQAVHAGARELGCGKVTLEVNRDNAAAQRFYARLGYGDGQAEDRGDGVWFWRLPL